MRKSAVAVCLVFLAIGIVGIYMSSATTEQERVLILESRAKEFYDHVVNKRAEKIWDMLDEEVQKSMPVPLEQAKAEYIKYVEYALKQISVISHTHPEIVWRTKRYAVTKSKIKFESSIEECEQTAWVWRKFNWYVIGANVPCDMVLTEEFLSNFVR